MTEQQIKKCRELSTERDNLTDFLGYLVRYEKEWWKVVSASDTYNTIKSETEKGIEIPRCLRNALISDAKRKISDIDEELKAL